jgi:protein phosphatase 2C
VSPLLSSSSASSWDHIGSTAVVAVLSRRHIIVGNCGDSRAILCRHHQPPIPLSEDHKVKPSSTLSLSLFDSRL